MTSKHAIMMVFLYIGRLLMDLYEKQLALHLAKDKIMKKFKLYGLFESPALTMLGIVLWAKLEPDPEMLPSILLNTDVVNGAIAIIVPWMIFCTYKQIRLVLEIVKLNRAFHS